MATFNEAFAKAKKAGKDTFTFKGKKYTTETKDEAEAGSGRVMATSTRPKARNPVKMDEARVFKDRLEQAEREEAGEKTSTDTPKPKASASAKKASDSTRPVARTKDMSFKEAFADARKAGQETFQWRGKKYTTETKMNKGGMVGTPGQFKKSASPRGYK